MFTDSVRSQLIQQDRYIMGFYHYNHYNSYKNFTKN